MKTIVRIGVALVLVAGFAAITGVVYGGGTRYKCETASPCYVGGTSCGTSENACGEIVVATPGVVHDCDPLGTAVNCAKDLPIPCGTKKICKWDSNLRACVAGPEQSFDANDCRTW